MGRPRMWESPEDMEAVIDLYALDCLENSNPMTVVGMALFLGFCDRSSLYEYQDKEAFTSTIKKGRAMVEQATLAKAMATNGAGAIFYLKNLGYSDRQRVEIDPVKIVINVQDAKL